MVEKIKPKMHKLFFVFLLLDGLLLMALALFFLYGQYRPFLKEKEEKDSLQALGPSTNVVTASLDDSVPSSEVDLDPAVTPPDFSALRKQNPDYIGWVEVPGTAISYPFVQGKNNETYLHRSFNGMKNATGAIFLDALAAPDFSDYQTIIYGHNIPGGHAMFSDLSLYLQSAFFNGHPAFTLYFPEYFQQAEIFAIASITSDAPLYQSPAKSAADFAGFGSTPKDGVVHLREEAFPKEEGDRIVVLSTCALDQNGHFLNDRTVLLARIREDGKKSYF